jgi:hypothetical protein
MAGLTQVPSPPAGDPARAGGEVRFVNAEERIRQSPAIAAAGFLVIDVPPPPWMVHRSDVGHPPRGRLREAIEAAVETALHTCGAPSPGVSDMVDLDQCLSDQLFRARTVGAAGFALYLPPLADVGSLAGALDAEDSAVLRWWIAAATERPVVLLLDERNRRIGAYGPPVRLERIIDAAVMAAETQLPHSDPLPDAAPPEPIREELLLSPEPPRTIDRDPDPDLALAPNPDHHPDPRHDRDRDPRPEPEPAPQRADPPARIVAPKPMFANRVVPLFPRRETRPTGKSTFEERGRALAASLDWRGFANELEVARGPKPLTIIERLFMSRYIPLLEAVARGEADEAAGKTAEQWAENFARSYTEGFSALKVTGKRPRMVLDAPQIGSQIARLHGAKSTQLVLVDAMRFDLGVRIHDRMRDALTSQATCTERLLLWSALPTTTPVQLDLLAHGPEGLASRGAPSEREEAGLRGRTSATIRRIKVGNRDIYKLDSVEAHLRESGPALPERLDEIADDVAASLAVHARTLAPRTLMFVFGDHGFRMEPCEGGTLSGTSGGASPEEVLVPAFAWLIGDVH